MTAKHSLSEKTASIYGRLRGVLQKRVYMASDASLFHR